VQHLVSNQGIWNDWDHTFDPGPILQAAGLGDGGVQNVRSAVDGADTSSNSTLKAIVQAALRRVFGAFAILMTSVGVPMWLAGEEFGDVHDTDYIDVNAKQQDPVQWNRAAWLGNAALKANVAKLIQLRTSHLALQRNEVEFFYSHPAFDDNDAPRVFAYCRSGGQPLGTAGQVIVIANMGPQPRLRLTIFQDGAGVARRSRRSATQMQLPYITA
jgi:1,4-alpha-glucan branching enzyme